VHAAWRCGRIEPTGSVRVTRVQRIERVPKWPNVSKHGGRSSRRDDTSYDARSRAAKSVADNLCGGLAEAVGLSMPNVANRFRVDCNNGQRNAERVRDAPDFAAWYG